MTITVINAKTLKIGVTMSANRQSATQTNLALNILKKMAYKNTTPEQQVASDRSFVIRCLAVGILFIVIIFGYSVVKEAQPLFSESPTDKAIIAVLSLVLGQAIQIIANYLTSSKPTLPPSLCPPALPAPTMPSIAPVTPISPVAVVAPKPPITPAPVQKSFKLDDDA
jgi:hypothetical protein